MEENGAFMGEAFSQKISSADALRPGVFEHQINGKVEMKAARGHSGTGEENQWNL